MKINELKIEHEKDILELVRELQEVRVSMNLVLLFSLSFPLSLPLSLFNSPNSCCCLKVFALLIAGCVVWDAFEGGRK